LIRSAAESDVAAIARIYGHHVLHGTATFELEPPTAEEMARRLGGILTLGFPYLVAERDGVVVGYAYANSYRPRPGYRFTVEDSIYVDPAHAGTGCGRALLTALIERCEQGPWRQMVAVIGDSSNTASIRLHERFGFRHVGRLEAVCFKFGRWVDSMLMQRPLGAGASGALPEKPS
jgi:phosphinothricin acetyltransferase